MGGQSNCSRMEGRGRFGEDHKKEGGGGPWESTALMCGSVWNTVPCSRRKRVTVAFYIRGLGLRYSLKTRSTVVLTVSCSKHRGHPSTTYRGCQPFMTPKIRKIYTIFGYVCLILHRRPQNVVFLPKVDGSFVYDACAIYSVLNGGSAAPGATLYWGIFSERTDCALYWRGGFLESTQNNTKLSGGEVGGMTISDVVPVP